ncbi:unnamed protein product [Ilex paraguariensis]|uniref:Uncharacterized protein n=1 Tax=Ilex paraguariensis TaxID=185542 RepID=A0ABC8RYH5_9AQUA
MNVMDWNKSLVKKTADNEQTPLHYAARLARWYNIASQLLDEDNSVAYVIDNDKNTTLHLAAMTGKNCIFEEVKLHTPDCWKIVNGKRQNILHIALEHDRKYTAKYIIENNRGINTLITEKDVDGNAPFHLMAASNCLVDGIIHHDMVAKNALNNKNLTPLDMVPNYGRDVEDALINAGATWSWRKEMSRSQDERKITITKKDRKAAEKEILVEKKERRARKKERLA